MIVSGYLSRAFAAFKQNKLIVVFTTLHLLFAASLGRLFALAPDEAGYLYAFNNVYVWPSDTVAQSGSGWLLTPTFFLWIAYLPAKVLNICGVPDYLSIRCLSIILVAISLYLLKSIIDSVIPKRGFSDKLVFSAFFIPSIFLWTSLGLRESFILAEIAAFLVGLNFLFRGRNLQASILLFLGSFGLISTKIYLWLCLVVVILLFSLILVFQRTSKRKILKILIAGFLMPVILFAVTTSDYALNIIFKSDITTVGERPGDSITTVVIDPSITPTATEKVVITFHGDYTLIALYSYLTESPNSVFTKFSQKTGIYNKIKKIFNEKVALGLDSKDNNVGIGTSSLNGHILEPGKISNPLSFVWPAFVFLCGPFPFIGNPGIVVFTSSLESPLWWTLYALVISQFIRFRKVKFIQDPQILFTLIFLAGEIALSALVEVNLGTSFRHRSIILVPLVFLYVRLAQKAAEQKEKDLETI